MQMYVSYYDRKIKLPEENHTVFEFTLPENNDQIFAKVYRAVLPSKDVLKKQSE